MGGHYGNPIRAIGTKIVTPEAKVKKAISKLLSRHKVYFYMPVPYGYGPISLDYLCCVNGRFFAVEAKAPGKKPTVLQDNTIERMRAVGGVVFVIDGTSSEDYTRLEEYLNEQTKKAP